MSLCVPVFFCVSLCVSVFLCVSNVYLSACMHFSVCDCVSVCVPVCLCVLMSLCTTLCLTVCLFWRALLGIEAKDLALRCVHLMAHGRMGVPEACHLLFLLQEVREQETGRGGSRHRCFTVCLCDTERDLVCLMRTVLLLFARVNMHISANHSSCCITLTLHYDLF